MYMTRQDNASEQDIFKEIINELILTVQRFQKIIYCIFYIFRRLKIKHQLCHKYK
jgi:hypothetical protein